MVRTYRVELETDTQTGQVCATLPALNDLSDFGEAVEEALANLRQLAEFALRCRLDDGEPIPPSDPVRSGELYLSVEVPSATAYRIIELSAWLWEPRDQAFATLLREGFWGSAAT